MQGRPTGGVYKWSPGDRAFSLVKGTELPGNNGIETSPDGKYFYVVAFGWHSIVEFDRKNPAAPIRRFVAPDFMPDNIQWHKNGLIAAGMRLFEPTCGGYRKIVNGVADPMLCHRGYSVALIALPSGSVRTIAHGGPEIGFNGVSTAVLAGDSLWLGSYQSDRLAYRPIK
jgi:sugar lactone lactonase YvrE